MRNEKLIPGLILVIIGAAFLLHNYGYLHIYWWNIFRLWPIFLVIAGINLVFAHNRSAWATILKIAVVVFGLGLILFGNFGDRYSMWPHFRTHYDHHDDYNDNSDDDSDTSTSATAWSSTGSFNEPYQSNIKVAKLHISGGATSYTLSDTTNQLFNASTQGKINMYSFSHDREGDSVEVLNFKMKDQHSFNFDSDKNKTDFQLNSTPLWDIYVETGAASLDFDLSKFKVRKLQLHGGAASFHVKMGMPVGMTNVDVSTGVSGVDISIPQNAACSIETDSGLSDNNFDGFTKTGDNHYETPGYENATNKMHIHISGGLSGFNVKRY